MLVEWNREDWVRGLGQRSPGPAVGLALLFLVSRWQREGGTGKIKGPPGMAPGSNCEAQLYSSDHTSFSSFHFRCLLTETLGTWPQTQGSVLALCDGK